MKEKKPWEQLGYDFDPPFYASTSIPIVTRYDRLISKSPEELADLIFYELSQFPDKASLLAWLRKEVGT